MEKQNLILTPFDHLMPRRYVVKLLYFPRSNPDITSIAAKLTTSLKRTFDTPPILSGTVQSDPDRQRDQEGALCVDAPWMDVDDIFVVNDLTSCEDLVYADLKREHFRMTTTERYNFCSVFFTKGGGMKTLPAPVMMAQVNLIRGGMVLAQCLHHSFMDGPGGVTIMGLWAAFCRGEDGEKLMTQSMWDRTRLMQHDEGGIGIFCQTVGESKERHPQPALQADNGIKKQGAAGHEQVQQKKEIDTEIFFFSHTRLAALKAAVSATLPREDPPSARASPAAVPGERDRVVPRPPGHPSTNGNVFANVTHNGSSPRQPYVSTNDALSALLFTCVTVARSSISTFPSSIPRASASKTSHHPPLPRTVPLGLTVSAQRLFHPPLPETYIGNASLFCHLNISLPHIHPSTDTTHTMPTPPICTTPQLDPSHQPTQSPTPAIITPDIPTIAGLASRIRTRLLELDEKYVRGLIGALGRVSDLSKVMPACWLSGAGAPVLAKQRQDDDQGISSTSGAGESAGKINEGDVTSSSSSSSSSTSWAFVITPWTTQGFYALDFGAELLGGRGCRDGLVAGADGAEPNNEGGGFGSAGVRMGMCERVRIPKSRLGFLGWRLYCAAKIGGKRGERWWWVGSHDWIGEGSHGAVEGNGRMV